MAGGGTVDIEEIAAVEILIQALDAQARTGPVEIGAAKNLLRKYLDTHSLEDFAKAKKAFEVLGLDIRESIKNSATGIAQVSGVGGSD